MSDTAKPCEMLPCPLCGEYLRKYSEAQGYYHPKGNCALAGLEMEADGYSEDRWNTRTTRHSPEAGGERLLAAQGFVHALELIEIDLEAGDMPAKTRVKLALSRTKAWLNKARAALRKGSEQ